MPEPVVIIGPANRPAGPIAESAGDAADTAAADTGNGPGNRRGKFAMLAHALTRVGGGLFGLLARLLRAVGALGMAIFRRYPRHSLAAGASVIILGAIWYSEIGSRGPVTTQISGKSSPSAPAPKETSETAGAPADAGPAKLASKGSGDGGAATPESNAMPSPGPAAPDDKPTPAPTIAAKDDAAPALPSLPDTTASDLAAAAKPEPTPPPASSIDPSASTLLASVGPDPTPPSNPAAGHDAKANGDLSKPAAVIEAPAPFGALASSPAPPPDFAPAPAPTGDPVQLATGLDDPKKSDPAPGPASKPPTPEPASAPTQQPAAALAGPANADTKAKDAPTVPEPQSAQKSADTPNASAAAPLIPPLTQTEPAKTDAVKPEPPQHEPAKGGDPAAVAIGSADKPKDAPVVLPTPAPASPISESTPADTARPPGDHAASPSELSAPDPAAQGAGGMAAPAALAPAAAAALLDSHAPIPDSRSQAAESKTPAVDAKDKPDNGGPPPALQAAGSEPHGSGVKPAEPEPKSRASRELASAGWVSVPNSGKIVLEDAPAVDAVRDDASSGVAAAAAATRDVRADTAKEIDFEPESLRPATTADPGQQGRRSAVADGSGAGGNLRSTPAAGRVEPSAHVVEPEENFWTISRLYYSSGRYYRALVARKCRQVSRYQTIEGQRRDHRPRRRRPRPQLHRPAPHNGSHLSRHRSPVRRSRTRRERRQHGRPGAIVIVRRHRQRRARLDGPHQPRT